MNEIKKERRSLDQIFNNGHQSIVQVMNKKESRRLGT